MWRRCYTSTFVLTNFELENIYRTIAEQRTDEVIQSTTDTLCDYKGWLSLRVTSQYYYYYYY